MRLESGAAMTSIFASASMKFNSDFASSEKERDEKDQVSIEGRFVDGRFTACRRSLPASE